MTHSHPTPETLARLLAGTLADPAARREAASHLRRRCAICLRNLPGAADPSAQTASPPGPARDVYPELLARGLARTAQVRTAIAGDAVDAMACWTLLQGASQARRADLVRTDPRFHQWPLAQRLIETAADLACDLPTEAAEMCRLALAIAERLPRDRYPQSLRHDLRARAHGLSAEALRREGRLREARRAFGHAWLAADQGSGDPLERAALLSLEANLHLTLGDFPAAIALLRPAAAAFRLHRESGHEGRALYKLALAMGYEQPQRGAALARRALARIDATADPRLDLATRHALIWFLNDSGDPLRALDLLTAARPLYRRLGESASDRLMPWIEARLCRSLGELAAAERGFAAVWHALHPTGRSLDLTLITLDLVDAYLAQHKLRAAHRLLRLVHHNLIAWQLHAQGRAAWVVLMDQAAAGSARARDLIPPAIVYFRRAWHRPLPPRR